MMLKRIILPASIRFTHCDIFNSLFAFLLMRSLALSKSFLSKLFVLYITVLDLKIFLNRKNRTSSDVDVYMKAMRTEF